MLTLTSVAALKEARLLRCPFPHASFACLLAMSGKNNDQDYPYIAQGEIVCNEEETESMGLKTLADKSRLCCGNRGNTKAGKCANWKLHRSGKLGTRSLDHIMVREASALNAAWTAC